jgi:hypothetical protein
MATDIVGSREKTFASEQTQNSTRGFGQNGFAGPSSTTPGKARAISKTYAGLATDVVDVSATAGEGFQTRTVSAKPYPTHPGTKGPSTGARVPMSTVHRANDAIIRPTRR